MTFLFFNARSYIFFPYWRSRSHWLFTYFGNHHQRVLFGPNDPVCPRRDLINYQKKRKKKVCLTLSWPIIDKKRREREDSYIFFRLNLNGSNVSPESDARKKRNVSSFQQLRVEGNKFFLSSFYTPKCAITSSERYVREGYLLWS